MLEISKIDNSEHQRPSFSALLIIGLIELGTPRGAVSLRGMTFADALAIVTSLVFTPIRMESRVNPRIEATRS